jgi:hypothetical protein
VTYCLDCHSDKDQNLTFKDGSTMSLYVDPEDLNHSVHASQLICTDCHVKYTDDHPSGKEFPSRREYTVKAYEMCKKCHFDTYTRTLESVHYELLKEGIDSAPICVDCHGSHNIQNPHLKRAMMSRSCAVCHEDVYNTYKSSVHGKVLVQDDNQDVPACTDCHTHHQVQQPGTNKFRLSAPENCIKCHGNEKLMAKYNISTNVAQTYLADFHGVTASLSRNLSEEKQQIVVTCNDCHGIHNIMSPKTIGAEGMKATVTAACAKCHQNTAKTFPAAWLALSDYRPTPHRLGRANVLQVLHSVWRDRVDSQPATARLSDVFGSVKEIAMAHDTDGYVMRFSIWARVQHAAIIITFGLLLITGMPQKWPTLDASHWVIDHIGGIFAARWLHRAAGIGLTVLLVAHIGVAVIGLLMGKMRPSMMLSRRDFQDAIDNLRYYAGYTDIAPKFGRYDYRQKFEYWVGDFA